MVKAHKHINLQRLIDELQANEYVHLKGQQNLTAIYRTMLVILRLQPARDLA